MIKSKDDYKFYIKCDEIAVFGKEVNIIKKIKCGYKWKFNKTLRKMEYNLNCNKGLKRKIIDIYYKIKMKKISFKTGWYICPNTFGPGLNIVHYGPVIVNGKCKFGANVRIQAMVNIGDNKGGTPHAGDNIYIGPGAKLFGDITLGSNIAIGANAVVNKSFNQNNITLGGVPAKIIAEHGCEDRVIDSIKIVKEINK